MIRKALILGMAAMLWVNAQGPILEGTISLQGQGTAEDLQRLTEAIEQNPESVAPLLHRGKLLLEKGHLEKSLEDFVKASRLDPANEEARYFAAVAHHTAGDMAAVLEASKQALAVNVRNPFVYALRGNAHFHLKDYRAALRDLNRVHYLLNDHPMAFFNKGRVYRAMGDEERAKRNFHMACALNEVFCGRTEVEREKETYYLLSVPPKPKALVCDCCEMYNNQGMHREEMVQRTLQDRAKKQVQTAGKFKVFKDFGFQDRYLESGIAFVHQIVDDSGIDWKPVHYDHGNGLALADVDGDGLTDLYFLSQMGANGLWRNRGDGSFEDLTEKAGVGVADRISVTASFADMDNDGDPDLFVTTVRMGNLFFENNGNGVFKDISEAAGLAHKGHSSGAAVFDYDNDGLLDLFLTNVGVYTHDETGWGGFFLGMRDAFGGHLKPDRFERSILYKNMGGLRFKDVSEEVKLVDRSFSGDASFTDLNGDGFADLYLLNMQGDDHYYENAGGKAFVEKTEALFPKTPWGSMGIKFFDYNNDGNFDLYITDMHSDMSIEVYPRKEKKKADMQWSDDFLAGATNNVFGNAFYHNRGKAGMLEVSDKIGVENYWPWGLSVGDLNADGYQDIFVTSSMNYHFRYGINSVFLNNRGEEFLDSEFLLGVEPRKRSAKPWFVLDCSDADKMNRHCNGHTGWTAVWGAYGSRTSALLDLEGDGDLDIVTGEFNSEPQVLVSDLSSKKPVNFLKIRLIGTTGNRDGLGAKVRIWTGDTVQTQFHDGKSGYLSQSGVPLYFGLDKAQKVDRIQVTWPGNRVQTLEGPLAANRILEVEENPKKP